MLKAITDSTLLPLVLYIRRKLPDAADPGRFDWRDVVDETRRRAVLASADYADRHMAAALGFSRREDFWRHAFQRRSIPGLIVEFGVWRGRSINFLASLTDQEIVGFDSFEGLREDWKGWGFAKGHFSLHGEPPKVAQNVRLVKGWFDETLPPFLNTSSAPLSLCHIDCDTYEASATVLRLAGDRFVRGTVVIFDEYFGYRGWQMGEFKAWQEFVERRRMRYEYLAFTSESVSLVIT